MLATDDAKGVIVGVREALEAREPVAESVRRLLKAHWHGKGDQFDATFPEHRRRIVAELGAQGFTSLGSDAESGGIAIALACLEEMGRVACSAPLLDAVVLNSVIADQAVEGSAREHLEAIRGGSSAVTLALGAFDGDPNSGDVSLMRRRNGTAQLNGRLSFVENTDVAHTIAVFAAPNTIALVEMAGDGVRIDRTKGIVLPSLGNVTLTKASASLVTLTGCPGETAGVLMRLGVAARALGAASRGFELAVAYAKERVQFGNPIGRYQAVQHKLADCMISIEASRLLLYRAATAFESDELSWTYTASAAHAFASLSLRRACLEIHHVFGGIGFWEDHEMPRHFRRIQGDLLRLGGVHHSRAEIARYLRMPDGRMREE